MKTRSIQLLQFLKEHGADNASEEGIAQLRKDYRRLYKKEWRQKRQLPIKELRPTLTLKQYEILKQNSKKANFPNPTAYTRSLLLNDIMEQQFIVNMDNLMLVSQKVGMAINTIMRGNLYIEKERVLELLNKAEGELLNLINSRNT
jgi:hypothetical protein